MTHKDIKITVSQYMQEKVGDSNLSIQRYIDRYIGWLKSEITFLQIGEYYEINIPFLDADNDYLQFYVKLENDKAYFTDDGYTLSRLGTGQFQQRLKCVMDQYGVQQQGNELTLVSSANEFAQKMHIFVQYLCDIRCLNYLANANRKESATHPLKEMGLKKSSLL